ncbi:MAG: radical SAM protein [Anaerolineae bacterium]|jgi:MoaA/NifB/PqqE/SkfB family radical SAM enzyme
MTRSRRLPSPGEVAWTFVKYNWLQPLLRRPFPPKTLVLYVTYRCNSRCVMCGIWRRGDDYPQAGELLPHQLAGILNDRLFADVEHLNINGGEPSLRHDLADLVQVAIEKLPRLRWISMSSNGLLARRLVPQVKRIARAGASADIPVSLALSLHGVADISDRVFGIPGAFEKQVAALEALQALARDGQLRLTLHCVISEANAGHLGELLDWSRARGLPIQFALGEVRERFLNQDVADQMVLSDQSRAGVVHFLRALSQEKRLSNPSAFRYHHLADMLQSGARRTLSCHYAMGGVILGSRGELYYCPHSRVLGSGRDRPAGDVYYDAQNLDYRRSVLFRKKCPHCPPYTFNLWELEKDVARYIKFLIAPQGRRPDRFR